MIQLAAAAFTMGILGSLHCVGMCGPLALSLPIDPNSTARKIGGALLYNGGRVFTYSLLGILFGAIGKTMALFGFQQWLSLALGIGILIFLVLPKKWNFYNGENAVTRLFGRLRSALGKLFASRNYSSLFFIGILNGLLPCGLVYMAVAASVATGDIWNGMAFMLFFGLGTFPMMWSVSYFGNYITVSVRQKIRKLYPYMMLLVACMLILRGMGLGIPYLSPVADVRSGVVHSCCHK